MNFGKKAFPFCIQVIIHLLKQQEQLFIYGKNVVYTKCQNNCHDSLLKKNLITKIIYSSG